MKITYLGHSCLYVEHEDAKIVIDPFLSGNPNCKVKPGELQVDAVVLTHGHGDHILDAVEIARNNEAPIVAINELALILGRRGVNVHPMGLGGTYSGQGFRVKYTLAFHSSSVEREDGTFEYAGMPAGVLVYMGDKTLYHAGDTALFGDMKLLGEREKIDAAALPIGDNFTMGMQDAALAAEWVKAEKVIPIHYNTFPVIEQDPAVYLDMLRAKGIEGIALQLGETIEI